MRRNEGSVESSTYQRFAPEGTPSSDRGSTPQGRSGNSGPVCYRESIHSSAVVANLSEGPVIENLNDLPFSERVAENAAQGRVVSPVPPAIRHLSRSMGAGRIIAISRLILAAYWVLAFVLDPPDTLRFPRLTFALISSYAAYAIVLTMVAWSFPSTSRRWQIVRHLGDLAVFAALSLLSSTSSSPFFLGFLFSLVCATLLFDMKGTLWTAGGALLLYVAITMLTGPAPDATLYRFVVRTGFLVAIAALLIQLKSHEEHLQTDYRGLADWPRGSMQSLEASVTEILQHAARVLRIPRVMVVWEDELAPVLHIAVLTHQGVAFTDEPVKTFDPVVDRSRRMKSFVSTQDSKSTVARSESVTGLLDLGSNPIHPALREQFRIENVVASPFASQSVSGWLLALDKEGFTEDDLVLTDIVAAFVESRLEQFYLASAIRESAVSQERIRFARDLHDGILQSLSGTALHLQFLRHLIENDVEAALQSLGEVEQALHQDQREVRSFITRLRSAVATDDEPRLTPRLAALTDRIQREWGLKVTLETNPMIEMVGPGMAEEIYGLIKEAVTNAAIHSHASRVCVHVMVREERAHIVIEDNGRGFPFIGRYDLETLSSMKRGPVTLKERVAALGGNLVVDSSDAGARLEIDVALSLAESSPA